MAAWGWPPAQQDQFLKMQYMARRQSYAITYPGSDHSILFDGEQPIGAIIVSRTEPELRLVDIAFLPGQQGKGAGSAVIQDLIREAMSCGRPLRLSVTRANSGAQRLYSRIVFVTKSADAMYIEMEYIPPDRENPDVDSTKC